MPCIQLVEGEPRKMNRLKSNQFSVMGIGEPATLEPVVEGRSEMKTPNQFRISVSGFAGGCSSRSLSNGTTFSKSIRQPFGLAICTLSRLKETALLTFGCTVVLLILRWWEEHDLPPATRIIHSIGFCWINTTGFPA